MHIEDEMKAFTKTLRNTFNKMPIEKKCFKQLKNTHLNKNEALYVVDISQNKIIYTRGINNLLGYAKKDRCFIG